MAYCRWSTDILIFRYSDFTAILLSLVPWTIRSWSSHYQLNRVNYWAARKTRIRAHSGPFVKCVVATRLITNNVDANKLQTFYYFCMANGAHKGNCKGRPRNCVFHFPFSTLFQRLCRTKRKIC